MSSTESDLEIDTHFNVQRVLISYGISFLGAYLATSLCEQLRASYLVGRGKILYDLKWFSLMGISLGGVGIWCMHFIGMSSVSLSVALTDANTDTKTSHSVPIFFNIAISIISLIVVIVMTTVGVMVSANDSFFMKTKGEILEMFIQDTSKLSIGEVRKMKNSRLFLLITTKNLGYLISGGIIAGSGVSVMHYIGMEAMSFQGRIVWIPELVLVSVMIAIIAATAAFWILFRLLSLFPNRESLRIVSSIIMGIAVCGMHYTGMVAATFVYEGSGYEEHIHIRSAMMNKESAYIPVIVAAVMTIMVLTIILLADLRGIVHRYNLQVRHNIMLLNSDSGFLSSDSNAPPPVKPNGMPNGLHPSNHHIPSATSSGRDSYKDSYSSANLHNRAASPDHTMHHPRSGAAHVYSHNPKHAYGHGHHHHHPTAPSRHQLQSLRPQLSFTATVQGLRIFPSFMTKAAPIAPALTANQLSAHDKQIGESGRSVVSHNGGGSVMNDTSIKATLDMTQLNTHSHFSNSADELMQIVTNAAVPKPSVNIMYVIPPEPDRVPASHIDDDIDLENTSIDNM